MKNFSPPSLLEGDERAGGKLKSERRLQWRKTKGALRKRLLKLTDYFPGDKYTAIMYKRPYTSTEYRLNQRASCDYAIRLFGKWAKYLMRYCLGSDMGDKRP